MFGGTLSDFLRRRTQINTPCTFTWTGNMNKIKQIKILDWLAGFLAIPIKLLQGVCLHNIS